MNRVLDRRVQFDERSRSFAAVDTITTPDLRSYTWGCSVYNDQGYEGACVGFAWSHELSARPKVYPMDAEGARAIYHRARFLDPWPGEDYEGTSVLAGVKAVKEMSGTRGLPLISEYRWAFGAEDAVRVIGRRGPLVLGINWYNDMFDSDEYGYLHPTGGVAGGHAILANGVRCIWKNPLDPDRTWNNLDQDKSWVRLHNSWGKDWGTGGDARITVKDLGFLLEDNGEACIPLRRSV